MQRCHRRDIIMIVPIIVINNMLIIGTCWCCCYWRRPYLCRSNTNIIAVDLIHRSRVIISRISITEIIIAMMNKMIITWLRHCRCIIMIHRVYIFSYSSCWVLEETSLPIVINIAVIIARLYHRDGPSWHRLNFVRQSNEQLLTDWGNKITIDMNIIAVDLGHRRRVHIVRILLIIANKIGITLGYRCVFDMAIVLDNIAR